MIGGGSTFRLVSRRRLMGLAFGAMHGARRGSGSDVGGSRGYLPGDDPDRIDWAASARLSSARSSDEFVVREYFADEAPRAVVLADRGERMAATPAWVPWLHKDAAVDAAIELISESVAEARGLLGLLELTDDPGLVRWCPPGTGHRGRALVDEPLGAADGPVGAPGLARALTFLALHRRAVPAASFVFVVSDFLDPPRGETWQQALDRGWDVVPIVVQDPLWEQSFPSLDGITVPLLGPSGRRRLVRLRRGDSERLRLEHEARHRDLLEGFRKLGLGPVVVSNADPEHVLGAFLSWSIERQAAWSSAA